MTYEQAFNLLDVQSLNGFAYQTVGLEPTFNPVEAKREELGLSADLISFPFYPEILNWTFGGMWDKVVSIYNYITSIFSRVLSVYYLISGLMVDRSWKFFGWFWARIEDFLWYVSYEFRKLIEDPWGWFYKVIYAVVRPLIDGITGISIDIWDFVNKIYTKIYNWLEPRLTLIKDWLWGKIESLWNTLKTAMGFIVHEILDPIGQTFSWLWDRMKDFLYEHIAKPFYRVWYDMQITWEKIKLPIEQSLIYQSALLGTIKTLVTNPGQFFKDLVVAIGVITSGEYFKGIYDSVKAAWVWLVNIFRELWEVVKSTLYKLAPSAPERGDELIDSALGLLGIGIGGFGALTGVSLAVSWLSKHHLGHLSAILYDASSYKYITGAVMGGMVFAAYTQPLKYFFNAKFRPYLPAWRDATLMYDRSIITDDEFKFFMKYNGIPDKWFDYYYKVYDKPVRLTQLTPASAWETMDLSDFIYEVTFFGLWPKRAESTARFLWWKGKEPWTSRLLTAMMFGLRRAFFTADEIVKQFRDLIEEPRTISVIDKATGERVSKPSFGFPTNLKLIELIGQWERRRLKADAMVDAIKVQYREDLITEDEARTEIAKFIILPEVIDAELAPIKYRKAKEDEPEKGKDLRNELKTVLTKTYKEGFITHAHLQNEIEASNRLVSEKTLILLRSEWEAYYDDMMDWRKIYVKSLKEGLITEAEFRRDLIDFGFRASKVELLIKYDRAEKEGRL